MTKYSIFYNVQSLRASNDHNDQLEDHIKQLQDQVSELKDLVANQAKYMEAMNTKIMDLQTKTKGNLTFVEIICAFF